MMAQTRPLTLAEGVPLCQVTIAVLLSSAGIRTLAIKGPACVALAIRPDRQSNDADILVDPARFTDAVKILEGAGWTRWVESFLIDPDALHSLTLMHTVWPCTLDLHRYFPGMLAPPRESFEALWRDRREVELAHCPVVTTSRSAAMAVEVLHVLRGVPTGWERAFLRRVIDEVPSPLTPAEQDALVLLAPRLGSSRTLAPLFEHLGVDAAVGGREDPQLARLWRRYTRYGRSGSGWMSLLNWRHPLRSAHAMARYVWPTEVDARRWTESQAVSYTTRGAVLRIRLRRGGGALRARLRTPMPSTQGVLDDVAGR